MDRVAVGMQVQIERANGGIHGAVIREVNAARDSVTVEWREEIGIAAVLALNPQLGLGAGGGGAQQQQHDDDEVESVDGGGGRSQLSEEEEDEEALSDADIVKKRYEQLTREERRQRYQKPAVALQDVPDLNKLVKENKVKPAPTSADHRRDYAPSDKLNRKVSLFTGDIATLEIDAIVNAATEDLAGGGGGVNGAIHKAAGADLRVESVSLAPCNTGDAKITYGYRLPANYVIHTVGPMGRMSDDAVDLLARCYKKALELAKSNKLKSIAFPRLAGRFPIEKATTVALRAVREWLETNDNADHVDRIIFCPYSPTDIEQYKAQLLSFFPQ